MEPIKVYLNIYDILIKHNRCIEKIGMGIFHTGVEINGKEYAYGGNSLLEDTGVYSMRPKTHDVFKFRQTIEIGEISDMEVVQSALQKTMKKYRANHYNMLTFNCNHFSHDFLILIIGRGLPPHLNRAAYLGSFLKCLVPRKYLIVTPP